MVGALHRIALKQVVRPHAHLEQSTVERLDRFRIVVDATQQHGLVAERNAGVGQLGARGARLVGEHTGTRVPMRTMSTWGIARTDDTIHSSLSVDNVSGSPPEMSTSRIAG